LYQSRPCREGKRGKLGDYPERWAFTSRSTAKRDAYGGIIRGTEHQNSMLPDDYHAVDKERLKAAVAQKRFSDVLKT
jgi:hypothetical protein